jgi:hypothetical protein
MAMCDRFADGDLTRLIKTGDQVTVNPGIGMVTINHAGKADNHWQHI